MRRLIATVVAALVVVCLICAVRSSAYARCNKCTYKGKPINMAHGGVLRKVNGLIRCKDSNGNICREARLKKGVKNGFQRMYRRDKVFLEESYKDGKQHGKRREFGPDGRLKYVTVYVRGKKQSYKQFHSSGKLEQAQFYENGRRAGEIGYNDDGKLAKLECTPAIKDTKIRKLCGFGGQSKVVLYSRRGKPRVTMTLVNGKRHGKWMLNRNGQPKKMTTYVHGKQQGPFREYDRKGKLRRAGTLKDGQVEGTLKEYHHSGKLLVEKVVKARQVVREKQYYLNGRAKEVSVYLSRSKKQVKRYHDNGKLKAEGTFMRGGRWGRWWSEEGKHTTYHENGKVRSHETYVKGKREGTVKAYDNSGRLRELTTWKNGRVASRKQYDANGKLTKSEEYEADGSRKR